MKSNGIFVSGLLNQLFRNNTPSVFKLQNNIIILRPTENQIPQIDPLNENTTCGCPPDQDSRVLLSKTCHKTLH